MSEIQYEVLTDFELEEISPNEWCLKKFIGFDPESPNIEIPNEIDGKKIVALGSRLFQNNCQIERLKICDGIKKIGYSAFSHCSNLENVSLPMTLVEIDDYTFEKTALSHLHLPTSVTIIGKGICQECNSLRVVVLSENISCIPRDAFEKCWSLRIINIPSKVKKIESSAFYFTQINPLELPDTLEFISDDAWHYSGKGEEVVYCTKNSVAMDWARKNGYKCADYDSRPSERYKMPIARNEEPNEANTEIKKETSKKETITIVETSTIGCVVEVDIEKGEKLETSSDDVIKTVESFIVDEIDKEDISDPWAMFDYEESDDGIVIKECKDKTLKKAIVPDGVFKIDTRAFYGMEELEEIVLPEGLLYIGWEVFKNCKKLKSITLPDSLLKIGRAAFWGCLGFPLGDYFVIPKNVVEIEPFALPYAFLSFKNEDNWVRVDWLSKKEKFMGKVPSDKLKSASKARDYYYKNNEDTWKRK